MLVRRVREALPGAGPAVRRHVGDAWPSAGTRRRAAAEVVAEVASRPVRHARSAPEHVIGETLRRATGSDRRRRSRVRSPSGSAAAPRRPTTTSCVADPLARWIETHASVWRPRTAPGGSSAHAPATIGGDAAAARSHELTGRRPRTGAPRRSARRSGRFAGPRPGHRPPAVRLPAAPVPLQGRHRLRHRSRTSPTRHISPARTSTYVPERPRQGPAAAGVLPRVRPGVPTVVRATDEGRRVPTSRAETPTRRADEQPTATCTSRPSSPWPPTSSRRRRRPAARLLAGARRRRRQRGRAEVVPRRAAAAVTVGPRRSPTGRGDCSAAFVPAPFRFCLRCGVAYGRPRRHATSASWPRSDAEGRQLRDLADLGARSCARCSSLPRRRSSTRRASCSPSSTTARTPSLQAGHFNDFVQVTQLRGALYRAAVDAGDGRARATTNSPQR